MACLQGLPAIGLIFASRGLPARHEATRSSPMLPRQVLVNYRLTHSASELLGFTCTSSLTMNEKFQYRTRPPSAVLKNFEFIVSE